LDGPPAWPAVGLLGRRQPACRPGTRATAGRV